MDIAKFNQELSYKVAKANGLEKHKRYQEAIDLWLDISEMALNASKTPKIEVYYKSMLIEKTKQIINHIKDLKAKVYAQKGRIQPVKPEIISQTKTTELNAKEVRSEDEVEQFRSESVESSELSNESGIPEDVDEAKIIEGSDIKNLPIGFKEIEASKDFTIVTPHDKDHVKKMINQDHDISVFTHDDKEVEAQNTKEQVQPSNNTKMVCFACGSEIPTNSKVCPTCGTNLK
jgi:rubrerythrin